MDIVQLTDLIDDSSKKGMVKFVSESGTHTCAECSDNDGKLFHIDDPDLPQLPLHPNCRCKYVSADDPQRDVTAQVEEHGITANLVAFHDLPEAEAYALAKQITAARAGNEIIGRQKLFLLFNGRYLLSSDGKLLLPATAGVPIATEEVKNAVCLFGFTNVVKKSKFDYSYERQAKENIGALPQGLYTVRCEASGSLENGNVKKHLLGWNSWGNYHWRLVPSGYTDMRGRKKDSFTIHGGAEPGSAGCIDLTSGDKKFKAYLDSLNMTFINVYAQYPDKEVVVEYEMHTSPPIAPPAY